MFFFKPRIHESIAIAAVIAAAVVLHGLWITNLLLIRSTLVSGFFHGASEKSAVPSLYLFGLLLFLTIWWILVLVFKGRDCSDYREGALWFFVISAIVFFVMTVPVVVGFSAI